MDDDDDEETRSIFRRAIVRVGDLSAGRDLETAIPELTSSNDESVVVAAAAAAK